MMESFANADSDSFSLLPFAMAAGRGSINGFEAQQLVTAGHALLRRSASLVRALSGHRSAILLPSGHTFVSALAASDGRGAVLINPLASIPEIERQLADADVGAVFTNQNLSTRLPRGSNCVLLDDAPRTALVTVDSVASTVDLSEHAGMALSGPADTGGRDEEAVLVYTSAMAGRPLGAILTHRNLLSNARACSEALDDSPQDHSLVALPFAHLFGLIVGASCPVMLGGRVTVMERFSPQRALEYIETQAVTRFMGVPSMFYSMLDVIERKGLKQFTSHQLRICLVGGAPVPVTLQDRWAETTGMELHQGYGLTEAAPACLLNRADQPNRRGTLGTAVLGTEVSIRAANDSIQLAEGETGEICVRGPHVFRGYVSGGESGLNVRDGWLHTGDMGCRHSDGTVSFQGLIKAMFTRNGFNIYPREIESALLRMPGVHSARAWGIPDGMKEHAIAVEVRGNVTESNVRQWAKTQLAAYKVPGSIQIVP